MVSPSNSISGRNEAGLVLRDVGATSTTVLGWTVRGESNPHDQLWKVGGVGTGLPGITFLLSNPGGMPVTAGSRESS